jgi:serine/threonine-protein kinase
MLRGSVAGVSVLALPLRIEGQCTAQSLAHACHDKLPGRSFSMSPVSAPTPFAALAADWPALDALLDQALELPAGERLAWVDSLQREPPALRDTLRRLLERHTRVETGDFLDQLPHLPGLALAPTDSGEAIAGARVGPYRLISELGRGGMGAVWLAERADGQLRRRVALKLPRQAWGPELGERLARERDILASLEHAHIARLYDVGVDTQGRPYFAMEYVDGVAIDVYCREQRLGTRERLGLVLQVCAAVAHAHSRLVIHRDLKPGNMLVTAAAQVRLLDFGIAKALEGERTEETALTRLSGRALTPQYASPEQIRGEPLGTASDVYSLAVVTYELLTGAQPYRLKRGSAAELEEAIERADAPRASDAAALPALKKQLRGDLDAILNKALKKDPAQRYATIGEWADDLQRHLQGHAVLARPESRWYLARRFLRRHRLPATALAAVVVALSTGMGVALRQTHAAREQARLAEQAVEREGAVKMMYMDTLSMAAGWGRAEFEQPGAFARLLRGQLETFEKRYHDRPEERLGLLEATAVQLPFLGDYAGSLEVGRRYLALLTELRSEGWRVLRAHLGNARALVNLGQPEAAEALLQQGLDAVPDDAASLNNRVAVMSELGKVRLKLGKRAAAMQVLAAAEKRLGDVDDGSIRWDALSTLARSQIGHDDPAALRSMQTAHDGYLRYAHAQPAEVGFSHLLMGVTLFNVGRSDAAERHGLEALQRFRQTYGRTDRDTVIALGRLASAIAAQGRYAQARQLLDEGRAEVLQRPGADTAGALATLTARQLECEMQAGDLVAAARFATVAGPEVSKLPSAGDMIVYAVAEAEWLRRSGRAGEAVAHLDRWLQSMPASARSSPEAFRLTLASIESRLADAADAGPDAVQRLDELLATMRAQGATLTWLYREATEVAAASRAERGLAADAIGMLQALDSIAGASGVQPASKVQRADSSLRRARVLLAAGQRNEAAAAAASAAADLAGQHPQSPRLQAAQQLRAAIGP